MAIRIICPPGPYGGVISGWMDPKIGTLPEEIAIFQKTASGWTTRRLGVTAARLWSCDLGHRKGPRVEQWMAAVVSKGFDPERAPREGDRVFQVTQTAASTMSAEFVVRGRSGYLKGHVSQHDRLFPFVWWHAPSDNPSARPGWMPFDLDGIAPSSDRWSIAVQGGVQYAVLQVRADAVRLFEPAATSSLGTLPVDGVHATAFTSRIDIAVLTDAQDKLTGVVTGLRCAYDHHLRELADLEEPRDDERLHVAAWALHSDGSTTLVPPVLCEPSGYWAFEKLPDAARNAVELVVAVTTRLFVPSTEIPVKGGEVIAVTRFLRTAEPT